MNSNTSSIFKLIRTNFSRQKTNFPLLRTRVIITYMSLNL